MFVEEELLQKSGKKWSEIDARISDIRIKRYIFIGNNKALHGHHDSGSFGNK